MRSVSAGSTLNTPKPSCGMVVPSLRVSVGMGAEVLIDPSWHARQTPRRFGHKLPADAHDNPVQIPGPPYSRSMGSLTSTTIVVVGESTPGTLGALRHYANVSAALFTDASDRGTLPLRRAQP
jgi:hypothetical protein